MNLTLALWAPRDASEEVAREDVTRQASDWARAEPNVRDFTIIRVYRASDTPSTRWSVDIELVLRRQPAELEQPAEQQPTLWGAS